MEIILDFDGTLVEGAAPPFSWVVNLATAYGYEGSEPEALAAVGDGTDYEIADRLGIGDGSDEFTRLILEENLRCLGKAWWHPDLLPVLRKLADRHVIHVLSNRDQQSLEEGVALLGIRKLVHGQIGSGPGLRGKPATALYQKLRTRVSSSMGGTMYVGDKPVDREFARRSGVGFLAACWYRRILEADNSACWSLEELATRLVARSTPAGRGVSFRESAGQNSQQ